MKQTANLRGIGLGGTVYGDDASREAAAERARAAQQAMTVPYQVAPRQRVILPNGKTLLEGDEITAAMLEGFVDEYRQPIPAWRTLERLVRNGDVLEHDRAREMLEGDRKGA